MNERKPGDKDDVEVKGQQVVVTVALGPNDTAELLLVDPQVNTIEATGDPQGGFRPVKVITQKGEQISGYVPTPAE